MTEKSEPTRVQLSRVTDLLMSPARIRTRFDKYGLNRDVEKQITEAKTKLNEIKKEGRSQCPKALSEEDAANEASKKAYDEKLKAYNDYVSPRFQQAENTYNLIKTLRKIHTHLTREKLTAGHKADLETQVKAASEKDYASLVKKTNLQNSEQVSKLMDDLVNGNETVQLMFEKEEISKDRIRFNSPAAVVLAACMEAGVDELVEHAMYTAIAQEKKIIQPEHAVSSGIEKCSTYTLFKSLPHFKAVVGKQQRKEAHKAHVKHVQNEEKKKKKRKKDAEPVKIPSFEEEEVKANHAVAETIETDGKTKVDYKWYGIDVDRTPIEASGINFSFYVQQICKRVKERHANDKKFKEIRISSNIKKFASNLVIDFIARISPQLLLLIHAMKVKTVGYHVMEIALKQLIMDDEKYHDATGKTQLLENHQELFDMITEKVKLCRTPKVKEVKKVEEVKTPEKKAAAAAPPKPRGGRSKGRPRRTKK